ncbi:MAG: hypothetical protein KGI60_04155 [Patescibacteria group bacterium]|nr:hypothetical protein [Patescibacteria group bacterium]
MKKITVNKSDEVAVIVEKMIEADDSEITLSIPRFSHLGDSLSNFYLLKREADAMGKKVAIESVDDKVIELAQMSGLIGTNPFFAKHKRQFSDIVAPRAGVRTPRTAPPQIEKVAEPEPVSVRPTAKPAARPAVRPVEKLSPAQEWHAPQLPDEPAAAPRRRFSLPSFSLPHFSLPSFGSRKTLLWVLIGVAVLGGMAYAAVKVLPRADVKIVAIKKQWSYTSAVTASKAATMDIKAMTVPAQVFGQSTTGNDVQKFAATGTKHVTKSATGTITIYNSYSSDPQQLVMNTRFMTPDGKIYRLDKSITVPGATITNGKIVASSIDASVTADAAGPDYNIGPVKLFTIPGFKGTPKYESFYGESTGNMAGGFIGDVAYPTADDIAKAEVAAATSLESSLSAKLLLQVPKDFKILDGSRMFKVISQKADSEADSSGQFGVVTTAQATIIAFKESDVQDLLSQRAIADNGDTYELKDFTLGYGTTTPNFDKGTLAFPVNYQATLARKIDANAVKDSMVGKSETELKTMIFSLPGLESATVSLWPFWVKSVPDDLNKITVTVN